MIRWVDSRLVNRFRQCCNVDGGNQFSQCEAIVSGSPQMEQYNLAQPRAQRWVVRRKAEVLEALGRGHLSLEDACACYALTTDELISWKLAYQRYGLNGLRAMKPQVYRRQQTHSGETDDRPIAQPCRM